MTFVPHERPLRRAWKHVVCWFNPEHPQRSVVLLALTLGVQALVAVLLWSAFQKTWRFKSHWDLVIPVGAIFIASIPLWLGLWQAQRQRLNIAAWGLYFGGLMTSAVAYFGVALLSVIAGIR